MYKNTGSLDWYFDESKPWYKEKEIDKSNNLGDWWSGPNKHDWFPIRF